ncbi:adenine-specific DNA methyltransferase [Campylobacter iguaniorum]|uniref:site-specific DNA-methyltransferase (adenine-specific) n=1 Tax=Campylobacter iguaniorum TaxID=1244531 RepID=A0A076F9M8_9BACT|nr:DNA adenine methylase [Campylobacter iguaniorum]AII14212.1 adenine-specific DNA methyltransferase [Campylobacter iguaniorum]
MNYIGSKFKLSSWIKDEITKVVGRNLKDKILCDIFAGTGIIARTFKKDVKKVICNDLEYYSYVLNRNYIQNHQSKDMAFDLIDELNNLESKKGFIYQNYCLGSGSGRWYFSDENGAKIDAIRSKLELLKKSNKISDNVYYFLLASLLESADKVANTASVYGAFLKNIKKSAQQKLVLKPANFETNSNEHLVFQSNANELITQISGDILYLDPPYNARQYGANYHLLNTIAIYDEFVPRGKTGLREYEKSKYCSKQFVKTEFENLIKNAKFKYIFLSYNDEGLMKSDEIKEIMSLYGKYSLKQKEYQRYKADNSRINKADKTIEYLHILVKN